MENKPKSIKIDDVEYVRSDLTSQTAPMKDGMPYMIVRTQSAGVFAGYVESRDGQVVSMRNARRIYYWDGAATLSQLATEGTSKPKNCKFPCAVYAILLLQAIEILSVTKKAQDSIASVAEWKS